jgi:hypothetical protein
MQSKLKVVLWWEGCLLELLLVRQEVGFSEEVIVHFLLNTDLVCSTVFASSAVKPLVLGVDNVIQFGIVTAAGEYLTVNSCKHSDLFWALRGGGGGTYGILTHVTYRTHLSVPLTSAALIANFSSPKTAKTVITEFVRIHPSLSNAGWGGYAMLSSESMLFLYVAPNISWAEANDTINPFVSFARNASADGSHIEAYTAPFDSFYSWYKQIFSTGEQVGTNTEMGSRLIPRSLIEADPASVAESMLAVTGGVGWLYVSHISR